MRENNNRSSEGSTSEAELRLPQGLVIQNYHKGEQFWRWFYFDRILLK
jgi:hypothetical protein